MADLVSLEKAAELLGMTPDQLNDMRLKNEIFGTRVDNIWKFKLDEVQRFADDRNISLAGGDGSDFKLDDESLELSFGSSADLLDDSSSGSDSGVLDAPDELSFGSSDIALAASSSDEDVLADDEPSEKGSPSDTGKLLADSAELQLSEDDLFDDEISLQDSAGMIDSSDLSSDFEDSDLVLEDSDSSSDPALEVQAAESGISLSANESGISLEEPFELGGSDIDDLELPEDNEVIALEESAGPDSATLLQSDDNFDLTPLEDSAMEDSSSGSQVIALEDSAIYTDDSAPTMLGAEDSVGFQDTAPAMLEDTSFQPAGMATVAAAPETPYTLFNVLSLALALVMVTLGSIIAFDLARSMWQPADTNLTNTIANMFIQLTGMEP
ncbi:MAG: helix-turn-helix domain-containing protein [Pirellulaceae bacterium]